MNSFFTTDSSKKKKAVQVDKKQQVKSGFPKPVTACTAFTHRPSGVGEFSLGVRRAMEPNLFCLTYLFSWLTEQVHSK